jgi:hypothetical protein
MQKGCDINGMVRISILSLLCLSLMCFFSECSDKADKQSNDLKSEGQIKLTSEEGYSPYVRFSSFQNPDSTWGFTIFADSRPFLHYKKIPVNKSNIGFASKKDAETVAELFVKMIKEGNSSPKITRKELKALGIITGNK